MLNILVEVDKPLWRKGFQAIFHRDKNVRLWYSDRAQDQSGKTCAHGYDVIVLCSNGVGERVLLQRISSLKKRNGKSSFVLVTQKPCTFNLAELRKAGVSAFVDEHATNDQIVTAVSAASRKDLYVSASILERWVPPTPPYIRDILQEAGDARENVDRLSEREFETLQLVARGKSNRMIAKQLFISEKTVKNHLYNAYRKLGVRDRTQAVMAVVKGLLAEGNGPFGSL